MRFTGVFSADVLAPDACETMRHWMGRGLTGLRLAVRAARDGTLTGTFSFYALPANPRVPSGEATITGTYSATRTDIKAGHWIKQPPGYVLVGLIAGPPADNGTLLSGRVSNPGCSTFSVTKSLRRVAP